MYEPVELSSWKNTEPGPGSVLTLPKPQTLTTCNWVFLISEKTVSRSESERIWLAHQALVPAKYFAPVPLLFE